MLIRSAQQSDRDAVLELMLYLNPDDPEITKTVSERIFTQILNSGCFKIYVAEKNSSVVGSCYINTIPNLTRNAAPYAVIENVITHPDHRRQGVGNALISHALKSAKTEGCYKVMLLTGGDLNVQKFYKACGMQDGLKTAFIKRWKTEQ